MCVMRANLYSGGSHSIDGNGIVDTSELASLSLDWGSLGQKARGRASQSRCKWGRGEQGRANCFALAVFRLPIALGCELMHHSGSMPGGGSRRARDSRHSSRREGRHRCHG